MSDHLDWQERRKSRRFFMRKSARVLIGPERIAHEGTLMNISQGGLFVTTLPNIEIGSVAFMQFDAPSRIHCEATGRIVHTLPFGEEAGYGVAFHVANDALVDFVHGLQSLSKVAIADAVASVENVVIEIGAGA
jgi:hypothetical protein